MFKPKMISKALLNVQEYLELKEIQTQEYLVLFFI